MTKPAQRLVLSLLLGFLPAAAMADEPPNPKFWSQEDGQFDVSGFLDSAYGFLPIVVPITEPAVGFGAVGAVAFIDKPKTEDNRAGFGRPDITVVGVMGTENGTRGGFVGDVRHWMDDRLKTVMGVVKASVNLDFYGVGRVPAIQDSPLAYTLDSQVAVAQARYRIGESPWWVGLGYALATTTVSFDAPAGTPGLPGFERDSRVGGLLPMVSYDSRNSPFTPTSGTIVELNGGLFSKALGGDSTFQRYSLLGVHYRELASKWYLGALGSATTVSGDAPFYLHPFVSMRGVPAMRYQGEQVAQLEAEIRWQFHGRYSLVAFGGGGIGWTGLDHFESKREVIAGGLGVRYEIARKYGIHMGLDLARSRDGNAIYLTVGNAWMRP